MKRLLILATPFIFLSCEPQENQQIILYEGPSKEGDKVEVYHSEGEHVKVKMIADKYLELQNGDLEFPQGIYLEFYDEAGALSSTLIANSAYYFKDEDKWRGRGKVEVKNILKNEQLNTEELFWKPDTQKIFTDKFVTIRLAAEVIYGTGLMANQDLSSYTITKPAGEFVIED
ncbi:MAG: LPS export ABC transporter periplasmic protein LptC [Flammeovirgaceae bacterium]|nr:LPS export ABC transporter periplasmic protein LptC [Flammeovirgaceae bacterium]